MSVPDDLIERLNKLFYIYFKDDPEFQYKDEDFEEKEIITEIDSDSSTKYQNEIHLHFKSKKINVVKNLNITKHLVVYPYFCDFLPPSNIINSEIKYFVNKKEVSRDNLNLMLYVKESVNENRNIQFIFPKNCLQNIKSKLYIHEFGREILQLAVNYINTKLINKLLLENMWYNKRLEGLENKLNVTSPKLDICSLEEELRDTHLHDYVKNLPVKQESIESVKEEKKKPRKPRVVKEKK
jgi:hypothetical protein